MGRPTKITALVEDIAVVVIGLMTGTSASRSLCIFPVQGNVERTVICGGRGRTRLCRGIRRLCAAARPLIILWPLLLLLLLRLVRHSRRIRRMRSKQRSRVVLGFDVSGLDRERSGCSRRRSMLILFGRILLIRISRRYGQRFLVPVFTFVLDGRRQRHAHVDPRTIVGRRVLSALLVDLSQMWRQRLIQRSDAVVAEKRRGRRDWPLQVRRTRWSGLQVDILLREARVRSADRSRRKQPVHPILEHDPLVVALAHTFRLDAVSACWSLFSALYASLSAG